jgi:hypothetical protein
MGEKMMREMIGGYTLAERLELTLGNIQFQQGQVLWDDMEKLETLLEILKKEEEK